MLEPFLQRQPSKNQRNNLVFTSAGPWANVQSWLTPNRNWDLFLCNYGDTRHGCADSAEYYFERKGGKFPNLHYAYKQWPDIFRHYDTIFVLDDDVIFPRNNINRLFELQQQYRLWLLQPAFAPQGKVSHRLTRVRSFRRLTYSNFVEVCAPMFSRHTLERFLAVYDPQLVGWGIDYWLTDLLHGEQQRLAIIHEVSCINPRDTSKSGRREIETLQSQNKRIEIWQKIIRDKGITERTMQEYRTVWLPLSVAMLTDGLKIFLARKLIRYRDKWRKAK